MKNPFAEQFSRTLAKGYDLGEDLTAQDIPVDFDVDDRLEFYLVYTCPTCQHLNKQLCTRIKDGDSFPCEGCSDFTLTVADHDYERVHRALRELKRAYRL